MLELVSKICVQIEQDENLRACKYFFLLNAKENKYQQLQREFEKRGRKYSLEQLKAEMSFTEEEYDPFMEKQPHEDYVKYADALIAAEGHWRTQLFKKFSWSKLRENGIQDALASDSPSLKISVADLARFVNLASGNLYKNRDLILLMRRIGEGALPPDRIFRAFCEDYEA